jgi:peptidoglycan/xylan/chitin deacetylase (PgdA/CDA1 family)
LGAELMRTRRLAGADRPPPAFSPVLRRCGAKPCTTQPCRHDDGAPALLRRAPPDATATEAPPLVRDVLRAPGRPLDRPTRDAMNARFGYDFSRVRVHADARAAESARAVSAAAYTVGHHVVFAAEPHAPGTSEGIRLLAHELTHVVQQDQATAAGPGPLRVGRIDDPAETEAERNAAAVAATVGQAATPQVQRQAAGTAGDAGPRSAADAGTRLTADAGTDAGTPAVKAAKRVCLTFDDGPQPGTADVLDVLASKGAPATFFLTGRNMKANPEQQKALVERMLDEGHRIGNHTFTHDVTTTTEYQKAYGDLSRPAALKRFQDDYQRNAAHFQQLLGKRFPGFPIARLPGNGRFVKAHDKLIFVEATEALGMAHVTWHFELGPNGSFPHLKARDWQGVAGVAAEVDRLPNAGDVVLLHDRHWSGGRSTNLAAALAKLVDSGFSFGRLGSTGGCG